MGDQHGNHRISRRTLLKSAGAIAVLGPAGGTLLASCSIRGEGNNKGGGAVPTSAQSVADARGLTPDDVVAAVKTYVAGGKHDDYYMFASGGHSGQVLVLGLPSMRLLKLIAVFTPEPWQGYGFSDETKQLLASAEVDGKPATWGDTHHPALSETDGSYDGQFLFINDKAHARVAVIDLRDFETKQIIKNPLMISDHGGTFVTPNTEYLIEGSQYATPLGWGYAPIEEFKEKYRGAVTFWKFDRRSGRIKPDQSFSIELPPYFQDLADAGKKASDGWIFLNSFNTEMATGGNMEGNPPLEVGASQRDMDYLSVINWKKAEAVYKAGKTETVKGMPLIRMQTAVDEGILFEIPEPKSPHGVDVTPDGKYMVIAGKLDPQVTVYSFKKIQNAIAAGKADKDDFGIPVLPFDQCVEVQVELGLGPLHTQFDNNGYAYTSLFLDSAVARWKLGGDGVANGWTVADKIQVQYNIGHLAAVEGDTVSPQGKYLVSLDKWAIDRFAEVGPLHPQNFQLIDISGDKMQLLYDAPIGVGEPHYAQIVRADLIKPWTVYPKVGWDPMTQAESPVATQAGKEGIVRKGTDVTVNMTSVRSHFTPDRVKVKVGDKLTWHITNVEQAEDATHGFALPGQNVNLSIEPGETTTITFTADKSGVYPFYCTEFCSALHLEMMGYFLVEPA